MNFDQSLISAASEVLLILAIIPVIVLLRRSRNPTLK